MQLVCPAAPEIGCGSAAKPLLRDLERHRGVKEAWLNRKGTLIALVWQAATSHRQRLTASRLTGGQELAGGAADRAKADFFSRTNNWYRGADVDRLSEEEAEVIAVRLVRRTQAKVALPKQTAAALQQLIAETTKRGFLDPENDPRERLETQARERAKELLNEQQFTAFEQAYADGLRPLPNEP